MTTPSDDATAPGAAAGKTLSSATLALTIVRACATCGAPRTPGQPCQSCGNATPPEITDLGTVAATHRNPIKRRWWALVGERLATRRIRKAAARTLQLRRAPDPDGSDSGD